MIATRLPGAYRRYATSFIAFQSQGIRHLPLIVLLEYILTYFLFACYLLYLIFNELSVGFPTILTYPKNEDRTKTIRKPTNKLKNRFWKRLAKINQNIVVF